MALQHLRSSTAHKRPIPTVMSAGQIAINTNEASPGLFFKDSNGDLVKVGPVHIGPTAPNSSPASVAATALVTGTVYQILTVGTSDFTLVGASANTVGTIFTATGTTTGTGTVSGQQGVEKGEMWLDTTGGTYVLKIYDGTDWRSESGTFVDVSGDTMTGDLVMNNANIVFEGATADDFETTLTVTDPTADRTITLPNVTGTVVTTGDTGTVTSTMIADGTIVNADINASAAIAGTKIDPDFGSQTIETTGVFSAADGAAATPSITFTGDTNTGIYRPGADQVAISTNGTAALTVDSSQRVGIGTLSPQDALHISVPSAVLRLEDTDTNHISTIQSTAAALVLSADATDSVASSYLGLNVDGSERLRIDNSGRLLVGTSTPGDAAADNLTLSSSGDTGITIRASETDSSSIYFADGAGGSNVYTGAIIYDHATNHMSIHTNSGTEQMRIDSSGRLLVGTSTNTGDYHFQVDSNSGNVAQLTRYGADGATLVIGSSRGTQGAKTTLNNNDYGGLVAFKGYDGSNFQTLAWVGAQCDGQAPASGDSPGRLVFSTTADGASSPTERGRFASNGDFRIFSSNNGIQSRNVNGAGTTNYCFIGYYGSVDNGTGISSFRVYTNGNVENTNNSYGAISDIKLKENIVDANSQWDDIKALQVRNYNFIEGQTHTQIGVVAQEVETVSPGLVTESPDRDEEGNDLGTVTKSVNYSVLYMKAVKALQEAMERIETLEQRLSDAGIA